MGKSTHHDQVLPTMRASRRWGLPLPLVHVIDREVDSVDLFRRWDAAGERFLVRVDDRVVLRGGRTLTLGAVRDGLRFRRLGVASYRGAAAELWAAEAAVVLDRPAYKNVKDRRIKVAGEPLPLRYVAVQIRDEGRVLAEWMLLSNVPPGWADAAKLAHCYYWRWRIESFFKLLKGHGQQLERWRQETGPAVARRLPVAAMACVVAWGLQADVSPEAEDLKGVLVRLGGRQVRRGHPPTASALLAGLWVLVSMLALLEVMDLDRVRELARAIPLIDPG